MSKDTVTAYWIEAATGDLRIQPLGPNDLRGGNSYKSEIQTKYAIDPVGILVVPLADSGSEWAKSDLELLRARSKQMRAARTEQG